MSKIERNFVMFNDNDTLEFAATNYDVSKKIVKGYEEYFKYYNGDGNKKLDENELIELVGDLKGADLDDSDSLSTKEVNKLIKKITGKKGKVEKADRKKFFGFLNKIQSNYYENIGNKSDGKIDDFHQGSTGDCWLLTQMKALSTTDWGAQAINNAIKYDKTTGNYTVKFDGVDFETEITKEDIEEARSKGTSRSFFSKGDLDVLLLEMSVERYMQQEVDAGNIVRSNPVMYANQISGKLSLQYMLTGNMGHQYKFTTMSDEALTKTDNMSEVSKSNWKYAQDSIYFTREDKKESVTKLLKKFMENEGTCATFGRSSNGRTGHAFMLKDVKFDKEGNITDIIFIDPNITTVTRHESLDEFIKDLKEINIIAKDNDYTNFDEGFQSHPRRI